jgi:hypothetical protein
LKQNLEEINILKTLPHYITGSEPPSFLSFFSVLWPGDVLAPTLSIETKSTSPVQARTGERSYNYKVMTTTYVICISAILLVPAATDHKLIIRPLGADLWATKLAFKLTMCEPFGPLRSHTLIVGPI